MAESDCTPTKPYGPRSPRSSTASPSPVRRGGLAVVPIRRTAPADTDEPEVGDSVGRRQLPRHPSGVEQSCLCRCLYLRKDTPGDDTRRIWRGEKTPATVAAV